MWVEINLIDPIVSWNNIFIYPLTGAFWAPELFLVFIMKKKKILMNITIVFIAIGIGFLIAEGLSRLIAYESIRMTFVPKHTYQPDETLGWTLTPNFSGNMINDNGEKLFSTTEDGFRKTRPEINTSKSIVFIGDSFTFGIGVSDQETFVSLIQQKINAKPEFEFACINASVPAYSISQYRRWITEQSLEQKPSMVIVCLFMENDWVSLYRELGTDWFEPHRPTSGRFGGLFYYNINLYRMVKNRLINTIDPEGYRFMLAAYHPKGKHVKSIYQHLENEIKRMNEYCTFHEIPIAIVNIPPDYLVFDEHRQHAVQSADLTWAEMDFDYPTDWLNQHCQLLHIPYLDLTASFKNTLKKDEQPLYIPYDRHLNETGHQLAAQAIFDWLEDGLTDN